MPFDLAPTKSTSVQMALGDAIALCLMEAKGLAQKISQNHQVTLGKKLTIRGSDLIDSNRLPHVNTSSSMQDVLMSMTSGRYGATVVLEDDKLLAS